MLPNSPNVVLAAERAAELSDRDARVLDCTSQQAGPRGRWSSSTPPRRVERQRRHGSPRPSPRSAIGAVAPAARDDAQGRFVRGDAVGFVGGEIIAWGGAGSTLAATIERARRGRRDRHDPRGRRAPRSRSRR